MLGQGKFYDLNVILGVHHFVLCFYGKSKSTSAIDSNDNANLKIDIFITTLLLDFSLTVKAATLIFISGCGSAISSANEGTSGLFKIWKRVNKVFEPGKRACIS